MLQYYNIYKIKQKHYEERLQQQQQQQEQLEVERSTYYDPLLQQESPYNNNNNDRKSSSFTIIIDGLPIGLSLLLKCLYFLSALGSSTWGRFSAIYYTIHNLNPQQIGMIEGIRTSIPILSMILWGFLADSNTTNNNSNNKSSPSRRKVIWVITKTVSTCILLTLSIPYVYTSYIRILIVSIASQIFTSNGSILDAYTLDVLGKENKSYYGRYRLYASLSWGLGSIAIGYITDHNHNDFNPNFILFAILSFLMILLIVVFVPDVNTTDNDDDDNEIENNNNDTNHAEHENNNNVSDIVDDAFLATGNNDDDEGGEEEALLFLNVDNDDDNTNNANNAEEGQEQTTTTTKKGQRQDIYELLYYLLSSPKIVWFLFVVFIMGTCMATVERLLFLYLINDLKSTNLLCGLSVGVNVLFELPIFWYATQLLTYVGHDGLYVLAMICFVVRVFGYTYLTVSTVNYILLLECMHGITFACFWIVTTDISKVLVDDFATTTTHCDTNSIHTKKKWSTAIPSMIQMLYSALGVSLGSIMGGYVMHVYSSKVMYRYTAYIVSVVFIVHTIGSILIRSCCNSCNSRRTTRSTAAPAPATMISEDNDISNNDNDDDIVMIVQNSLLPN